MELSSGLEQKPKNFTTWQLRVFLFNYPKQQPARKCRRTRRLLHSIRVDGRDQLFMGIDYKIEGYESIEGSGASIIP
jgi:hypothetical protein